MKIILTSLLCLLLAGCTFFASERYEGVKAYPPVSPDHIQVLKVEPTEEHMRLGEVKAEGQTISSRVHMLEHLKEAAAAMGGDALILYYKDKVLGINKEGENVEHTYVYDLDEMFVPEMRGVVIKYK